MTNKYRIIVSLVFFMASSVYAGAWVQKKGEGLNILGVHRYISHQSWTSAGRVISSPTYAKSELDEYMEYGVTEKLTMGAYFSALKSRTAAGGTQGGVNDSMILGRYLLWSKDSNVISVQLSADKLGPASKINIPPDSSFNSSEYLLLGTSGQIKARSPQFWFADAAFGFVQRYSAGNQFRVDLEAGYKMADDHLWLLLQNYNTLNMGHPNNPQGLGYNLITISPSVIYWPTKIIGLQFGMAQDVYGQNVGKGTAIFFATWFRFGKVDA